MAIINGYALLSEFKAHITPPNQTLRPDYPDDNEIEDLLQSAARRVDDILGRVFYPRIQTMAYDAPDENIIKFGDDLLSLTTLTNGDSTVLTSSDYILMPANSYPKHSIKLRDTSAYYWTTNSAGSIEQVVTALGYWGYHEQYATRAWVNAGVLGAAMTDTTSLTATLTGGTLNTFGGEVIKVDNELMITTHAEPTSLAVLSRGDNGSTAATHLISSVVYVWRPMVDIKQLTLEVAKIMYRSRYGDAETTAVYTNSGVIVTPRSLPAWAQEIISKYARRS